MAEALSAAGTTVRPMTVADIDAIVELQLAFLEGSIITALGPGFLVAFYRAALAHPHTLAFVAAEDAGAGAGGGPVVGFALATLDVGAFNAHVKPRVLRALALAVLSPRGWRLAWSIVRGIGEPEPQPYMPAELLLLVVDSRVRRRRIGHTLLTELEAAFARAQAARYRVAVRSHLAVARAFYLALGFEPEQQLLVLGHPMTYLTKRVAR
ncbi:MAG: GNAT family N-acetyltransferase [Acidobacteriia bacterium]|nr:GNAT family N-acetyltransferase [Terriglobia bacterium]